MAESAMKFLLRTPDGKEYGPTDEDTLTRWAQAGRVTTECQVRNSLMKTWHKPSEFEFLVPYIIDETDIKNKKSGEDDDALRVPHSLTKAGTFKCIPANPALRFIALFVDLLVLGAIGSGVYMLAYVNHQSGYTYILDESLTYSVSTFFMIIVFMLYYTIGLGLKAQTVGQWFAGIMIIRNGGKPVLAGRAFIWTVFYLLMGWSTPIFWAILPGRRALQDLFSGTRVVKITVRDLA